MNKDGSLKQTEAELLRYCLDKPGAYEDRPFGPESLVVKVAGHIFVQFGCGKEHDLVTFKCSREVGEFYRRLYPETVTRGWHCPPVQQPYWNSMIPAGIPKAELLNMADHAYAVVVEKLSRKEKALLQVRINSGVTTPKT